MYCIYFLVHSLRFDSVWQIVLKDSFIWEPISRYKIHHSRWCQKLSLKIQIMGQDLNTNLRERTLKERILIQQWTQFHQIFAINLLLAFLTFNCHHVKGNVLEYCFGKFTFLFWLKSPLRLFELQWESVGNIEGNNGRFLFLCIYDISICYWMAFPKYSHESVQQPKVATFVCFLNHVK
jgi:hypothetical protein